METSNLSPLPPEPVAQSPIQPPVNPEVTVPTRGGKPWKKIIIVVALVAILGGGGAYAYIENPFGIFPSSVSDLKSALDTFSDVTAFAYDVTVNSTNTTEPTGEVTNLSIALNGKTDTTDIESPKGEGSLNFALTEGDESASLGIELKHTATVLYVKISSLSILKMFLGPQTDFSSIEGQWIKVDVKALAEEYGRELPKSNAVSNDVRRKEIHEFLMKLVPVIHIDSKLGAQTVEGKNTRGYKVSLNKEALENLILEYMKKAKGSDLSEGEIAQIKERVDTIHITNAEVWVYTNDKRLAKTVWTGDSSLAGAKGQGTISITLKDYNVPVTVTDPEYSIPVEEILGSLMGGGSMTTTKDTDGDGLPDNLEISIYKTDPNKADTDGDGYSDKVEIENGYNPLGPGKKTP